MKPRRFAAAWVGMLARFMGLQLVIQVLSLAAGILIVRSLTREDYAAYSLAVAVIAGCGMIAHSGFASTILARGAQVREDRQQLSRLVATAMLYRKRVTVGLIVAGAATLAVLLVRIDAEPSAVALLVLVAVMTIHVSASTAVLNELLALEYRRTEMQRLGVLGAAIRATGQVALWATKAATSFTTAVISLVAAMALRRLQRNTVRQLIDSEALPDTAELIALRQSFRQLLPANVLMVVQGQMVILVLGLMGHGGSAADLSAISRFAVLFAVLGAVVNGVLVPMVARAGDERLFRAYFSVCILVLGVGALAVVAVFAATDPLLRVLGPQYAGLSTPLRIVFVGSALGALADAMSSLNQARGWLRYAWIHAPVALAVTVIMINFVDVSTPSGAAQFALALILPGLLAQVVQFVIGARGARVRFEREPISAEVPVEVK